MSSSSSSSCFRFSTLAQKPRKGIEEGREMVCTHVPAVRMGFKAGKRIEFLYDSLVMRRLDLGSKSSCLSCCFLS